MKTKTYILFLFILINVQLCKAQQSSAILPKVENYTKGELELKIKSFGEENPITIGKVMADGTIQFNWQEIDLSKINENYWERSIKNYTGGIFCKDPNAVIDNEEATLVENKYIYLYKYNQPVGCIIPSTQKGQEHNKELLGTTIDWIYSYTETSAKANCSERKAWEDLYSFDETTAYDLKFKKGWNMVSYTLKEVEEWEENGQKRSLPKTKIIETIDEIPSNMYWQLKYWANDELLEIEQKLNNLKPITKQQYENWLPKKLGKLKRTNYEIGKELERMPTLNNVNLLFEKGSKKIDLTIVDCVDSKDAAYAYTIIMDMASRDWQEDEETGYKSAAEINGIRVLTEYNTIENTTKLYYNSNGRFSIQATGSNISPEELWEYLKTLNLEALIKE